jgi:hypothetical protein
MQVVVIYVRYSAHERGVELQNLYAFFRGSRSKKQVFGLAALRGTFFSEYHALASQFLQKLSHLNCY